MHGRWLLLIIVLALVVLIASQWLRDRQTQAPGGVPVLVIPALTEEVYTYQRSEGALAVLESESGRLELPYAWLPGEARPGDKFEVLTEVQVQPGSTSTTLSAVIEAAK